MKALVYQGIDKPLFLEERSIPRANAGTGKGLWYLAFRESVQGSLKTGGHS